MTNVFMMPYENHLHWGLSDSPMAQAPAVVPCVWGSNPMRTGFINGGIELKISILWRF